MTARGRSKKVLSVRALRSINRRDSLSRRAKGFGDIVRKGFLKYFAFLEFAGDDDGGEERRSFVIGVLSLGIPISGVLISWMDVDC